MKNLLLFLLLLFVSAGFGQAVLAGKITDSETGEDLIGVTVRVFKCDEIVLGGMSNLQVIYTGYETQKVEAVAVLPNRVNFKNIQLKTDPRFYPGCISIIFLNPPLYEKDKTSGGQTFTSYQLKNYY
jgi:hypothetical protein